MKAKSEQPLNNGKQNQEISTTQKNQDNHNKIKKIRAKSKEPKNKIK